MNNSIHQYSIGELLDGRYFYIPAYQRGYRWTENQVGDLLRDLLCFANDPKKEGDFYCLQPIIARPITNMGKIKNIFKEEIVEDVVKKGVWEIIDGQQRLTTIFLLYQYLVNKKGWDAATLFDEEGKITYHLHYETRKNSTQFLENMNIENCTLNKSENVDYFYMSRAFREIDRWIKEDGRDINVRYKQGASLDKVRNSLFSLLNGTRDTIDGSIQVLWYELEETNEKNTIHEFQKINTGKIRLTDAELVKGLFLLKRNFSESAKITRQSQLATEWEFIENTLHSNNFWYFLQKQKDDDNANRIELLFTLLYKIEQLKELPENEWATKLKEINKHLTDPRQNVIFRFYYNRFEGKNGKDLQKEVLNAWEEVMTLFRTLDDWFNTPELYNYIGLLSQYGEDISRLVLYFNAIDENTSREDFKKYLLQRIRYYLRNIKVDKNKKEICSTYKERNDIYKLLLALNIHILNGQNQQLKSESDIYKFPFDALNSQKWDIEHIDSYHTNILKRDCDKEEWIHTAREDRENELSDEEKVKLEELLKDKKYEEAINLLKKNAKEEDADDELKNSIGNLTLLDAETNRSYGNSLFCTKRKNILENMKSGKFILVGTQYVFAKLFDKKGTNRSYWTQDDMQAYHKFIYDNVEVYLNK